ncbi:MAG: YncE family protein [Nitrososphaerales archaeon]
MGPTGMALDTGNGQIYVSINSSGVVDVVNPRTNSVINSITVGSYPRGIVYDPTNGYMYVSNAGAGTVSVINTNTASLVKTITLPTQSATPNAVYVPGDITYDPQNNVIYVNAVNVNGTSAISGSTNIVIANIKSEVIYGAIQYDPANGYVYVAALYESDHGRLISAGGLAVINPSTNEITGSVAITTGPVVELIALAYDSSHQYVYVADFESGNITAINTSDNIAESFQGRSAIPADPYGVVYDSSTGYIYVSNYYQGTVTVLC